MKFEMTFSTIARCSVYNVDSGDFVGKVDINLILREEDCTSFLFRFATPIFKIGDFNVILRFDSLNVLEGIVFRKDDRDYIVMNFNQLLSSIHEGYLRCRTTSRIVDLLEKDDKIEEIEYENNAEIIDEFEDQSTE